MTQMTGGQALVQSLIRQGLDVIFGLPGAQLYWAYDALAQAQDQIRHITTRHEQATSYMADGYARTTGKIGACLVVPGPGVMNALAGLATAYACSSPVLCIAGQIPSHEIGMGRGELHEVPNQLEMMGSATKWAGRAMRPEEISPLVREAFVHLRSGRPRPVGIEIPPDVLRATAAIEVLGPEPVELPAGDPDLIEQAAKALGQARRPMIYAGGGVIQSGAWEALRVLAEMLQAPVVMTPEGKGAVSDHSYLAQSLTSAPELLPTSDVILVVGSRFFGPTNEKWGPTAEQTVIQLDIDPEEVGRNYPPTIGIVADANLGLRALVDRVAAHNMVRESREEELTALKERIADRLFEVQPQAAYGEVIREAAGEDGIVIDGMTQVGYWSWAGMPVYEPRTFVTTSYQGTLGFEVATTLGAQVGNPDKRVIGFAGDGGFMYNVQELATAVQYGINATLIVFNDNAFGNVRRFQREAFDGRVFGADLVNPDFVKLGEAFGIDSRRAHGPEGLRAALREVEAVRGPALIEVPVGEMPSPWSLLEGW